MQEVVKMESILVIRPIFMYVNTEDFSGYR